MKNSPSIWADVNESGISGIVTLRPVAELHCLPVDRRVDRPSIGAGFRHEINALRAILCSSFVRSTRFSQNIAPRFDRQFFPLVFYAVSAVPPMRKSAS